MELNGGRVTAQPAVVRLYKTMLLAYPRAYRQEYGADMLQLFCDQYHDAAATGQAGLGFWLRLLFDWAGSALREHGDHLRRKLMEPGPKNPIRWGLLGIVGILLVVLISWIIPVSIVLLIALGILPFVFRRNIRHILDRSSAVTWLVAGIIILAVLIWPFNWIHIAPDRGRLAELPSQIITPATYALVFTPLLAFINTIVLIYTGWRLIRVSRETGNPSRESTVEGILCGALALVILVAIIQSVYWMATWDSTYDPVNRLLLIWYLWPALFTGFVLTTLLPAKARPAGFCFLVLTPIMLLFTYQQAKQVDFRALTSVRAERIAQALDVYHAQKGEYPARINQLTPRYILSVAEPVLISGQPWCYESDGASYLLGASDRPHWSSPEWFVITYASQGNTLDPITLCADQIAAEQKRSPGYFGE